MRPFAIALTLLTAAGAAEARTVTLQEAARDPNLDVQVVSPGGYNQVDVLVRNKGEENVRIAAALGDVLENPEPSEQNLILGQAVSMEVGPGEKSAVRVGTYCINPDRSAPSAGARFTPGANDRKIAAFVRRSGGGAAYRADLQNGVWSFVRSDSRTPQLPARVMRLVEQPIPLPLVELPVQTPMQAPAAEPLPPVELRPIQMQPEAPVVQPAPERRRPARNPARRPHAPAAPDPQPPIILIPD